MSEEMVLEMVTEGVKTVIFASAPPLLLGLVVGLVMSIFQTVTSIQEPTLAFIPKIIAVLLSLILFGPFMLNQLESFFILLLERLPIYLSNSY